MQTSVFIQGQCIGYPALRIGMDILNRRMGRSGLLSDHTLVSAPVFDYKSQIVAVVTLMGPINALDDKNEGNVAWDLWVFENVLSDNQKC